MKWFSLVCLIGASCTSVLSTYTAETNKNNYERREVLKAEMEDANLQFVPLVKKYGYPIEEYVVTTKDGYVLTLYRIPHGRDGSEQKNGVVFLQHGLECSSMNWVIAGPEKGLAYLLADRGYDVWLGNARGNMYSRKHTSWDTNSQKFWDFSWHEIGIIDLPAMIDFVLATTGEEKLLYIGHSQGTTTFYVMASELPEYNKKIRASYSLGPIAFMDHMTNPFIRLLSRAGASIGFILKLIGMHEFLPSDGFMKEMGRFICRDGPIIDLCQHSMFLFVGYNPKQYNETLYPIVVAHTPAGASTKQVLHYAQLVNSGGWIRSGHFRQYDYGILGNPLEYGQLTPPDYDLSKITAPVYLFYSSNDWLAAKMDVERLYDNLGNPQAKFLTAERSFNHLDFLYGNDVDKLVYEDLYRVMLLH